MNYGKFATQRGLRGGLFGAVMGAGIVLIPFFVIGCGIGSLLDQRCPVTTVNEILALARVTAIAAAILGVIGFAIGYLTASLNGRIWGWRILGSIVTIGSLAFLAWMWQHFLTYHVSIGWYAYAMSIVALTLAGAGVAFIRGSRKFATDGM